MEHQSETISRAAHWVYGIFVICMLSLGFYMTHTPYNLPTYQLHKSLGVIFLALVLGRVYTAVKHPWQSSSVGTGHESMVRIVHRLLLALLIAMPITGFLSSGFSGFSVHLFDLIIVPENHAPSGEIAPFNATAYAAAKLLHRIFSYVLAGLVGLHILAALKHHFIDKDATLSRMLRGRASAGRDQA